jgi:NTE family protein
MLDAFNITQDRIARSRLAGDPPDVMINARLAKIGLFEFYRAEELIALGREAARRALDDIAEMAALERKLHDGGSGSGEMTPAAPKAFSRFMET